MLAFSSIVYVAAYCSAAVAAIQVELDEPSWEFVLGHIASDEPNLRISQDERELLTTLLPLIENGQAEQALRVFEQQDITTLSVKMRELYGQVLLNTQRYNDARKTLELIVEEVPTLASAHRSLSLVYLMLEALPDARRHLTRCIELGVNDAQVFGQLAYTNLQLGNAVTAISGYQQALLLQPDNSQWYQGLLFALIQSNSVAQADSLLEQMLTEAPDSRQLWLQRGQLALKQNNKMKAISSLETALSLGDDSVSNVITLAKLHVFEGSVTRGANLLAEHRDSLLKNSHGDGVKAFIDIANYLVGTEQWGLLKSLLPRSNSSFSALTAQQRAQFDVLSAQLAVAEGREQEATEKLQNAISMMPDSGEALLALAQLYRKQKKVLKAKMLYVRAQALESSKQRAMLGQAQMAIEQHDYAQALALLRDVVKAYPSRTDLLGNIAALEKILKNTV